MDAVSTPRPTCWAFLPPKVAEGPDAVLIVWLIASLNVTLPFLKPCVLTLAMLLPITSSFVCIFFIPLIPEYKDRNIFKTPFNFM